MKNKKLSLPRLFSARLWAIFAIVLCLLLALGPGPIGAATGQAPARNAFAARGMGGGGGMFVPSISPYNPDLMIVACDMGGVYRSDNGGKSWDLIPDQQRLRLMHLAPKPVYQKARVYWVTWRNNICFSEDAARTWTYLPQGPWQTANMVDFAVLGGEPDRFLVSTEIGLWWGQGRQWQKLSEKKGGPVLALGNVLYASLSDGSLLASRDRGASWGAIANLGGEPTALAGRREGGRDTLLAAVRGRGLIRSLNNGAAWEVVKRSFDNETVLVLPPKQPGVFWALQSGNVSGALLRSNDNGATWESVFRMPPPGKRSAEGRNVAASWVQVSLYWGYYFTARGLEVSAVNPDLALVTTQGELYVTRDGGKTWACAMNAARPPLPDGSERFTSIGLEVTSTWGYYFDPHDPAREYIGYTDVGFARSLDKGASWSWAGKGLPWFNTYYDVAFDPAAPGRMYAAISEAHDIPHYLALTKTVGGYRIHRGGIAVSDDHGATWRVPYKINGPDGLPDQICTSIALDPASPPGQRTLYAAIYGEGDDDKAGVYVSKDSGATWRRLDPGPGIAPNLHLYRLRIQPGTGHLYCLITGLRDGDVGGFFAVPGGIWKSTDKGATWRHMSAGSELNRWATAFAFDPRDPRVLYVTAAAPQGSTNAGGVFKTMDDGKTWFHILKDERISAIAGRPAYDHYMAVTVHPDNPDLVLVGTTLHGLLFSADRGKLWSRHKEFPFGNAQSITVNPRDRGRIYVTTFGAGVWEGPLPKAGGQE